MTWQIDTAHTTVGFSIKYMMVSTVRGHFRRYDAQLQIDPNDLSRSSVSAVIDVESIDTNVEMRDKHLRSEDFFEVENHPRIRFQSTKISRSGETFEVEGELTIRGITKPIKLQGEAQGPHLDPWGTPRIGVSLSGAINRDDFGVKWNAALEGGGALVAKTVNIHLEVQLVDKGDS